ncbi:TPA: hypothetical protein HA270_05080 [Candidatus Woesearchaeota archaeon]|nr:hypothetical protein [Candidatus Woesearchaeota archaeon]
MANGPMLKKNKGNAGFVKCYEKGNHYEDRTFNLTTSDGVTYTITLSCLFHPLQPHIERLHFNDSGHTDSLMGIKNPLILEWGGDCCSFAVNPKDNTLNFLIFDVEGHGAECQPIVAYLYQVINKNKNSPELLQLVEKSFLTLKNKMVSHQKNEKKRKFNLLSDKLLKGLKSKKYPKLLLDALEKKLENKTALNKHIPAIQVIVNLEKKVISCAEYGFGGAFLMYQEGINGICKPLRAGNDVKGNYPIGLSDAQIPSALMEDLPRAKKTRIVLFTDCFEEQKILIKEAALRELFPDLIEQLKEEMAELNKKKQEKINQIRSLALLNARAKRDFTSRSDRIRPDMMQAANRLIQKITKQLNEWGSEIKRLNEEVIATSKNLKKNMLMRGAHKSFLDSLLKQMWPLTPEQCTRRVYNLLIEKNSALQSDDLTLLVVDIEIDERRLK